MVDGGWDLFFDKVSRRRRLTWSGIVNFDQLLMLSLLDFVFIDKKAP